MDSIKSNLKAVVGSTKNGIPLDKLEDEYKRVTNSRLIYNRSVFNNLRSYLQTSMSDVVTLRNYNGNILVCLVQTENDPQCLKKLRGLIQSSRGRGAPFSSVTGGSGSYRQTRQPQVKQNGDYYQNHQQHHYNNQHNSNNNCISSISTDGGNFNNLMISIPNELFQRQNHNHVPHSYQPHLSKHTDSEISRGFTKLDSSVVSDIKSHVGNHCIDKDEIEENEPLHMWPININLKVNVLHQQVRVLGIQSGCAVLSLVMPRISSNKTETCFIDVCPVKTLFPGDFALWYPLYEETSSLDSSRERIDADRVFPVIVVNPEVGEKKDSLVQVRIAGHRLMMDVPRSRLFEYPEADGAVVRRHLKSLWQKWEQRRVVAVRLAGVPFLMTAWRFSNDNCKAVHVWDNPDTLYYVPVVTEQGQVILERCQQRGDFLNIGLILDFVRDRLPELNTWDQQYFIENLEQALEHCKNGLETLLCKLALQQHSSSGTLTNGTDSSGSDGQVLSPLTLISVKDPGASVEHRMMLGCHRLFSAPSSVTSSIFAQRLELDRLVLQRPQNTFHYFDHSCSEASVGTPNLGAGGINQHLFGVYMISDLFIKSRLSGVCERRFQAAMLSHIPSISSLKSKLNRQ